jgi:4'-phosphopantetheinyl transferase
MGSPALARRFLARRWMARTLLAAATGLDPGELVLERPCARCGRAHPASPLAAGSGSVWWSASSSAGLASVAIADSRVGLDLERDGQRQRWERIARRFYTEAERRAVDGSQARFLELWTIKEAFLKALGLGLAGGLRTLDCAGLTEAGDAWLASPAHTGWRFRSLRPAPGFIGAVALEGPADSIELRHWSPRAGEA